MRRSILFLLIIIACRLFLQPPPLLDGIDFSQAIYDDQHNLLRLTLSKDDKYRLYTPLEEISPLLIEATLLQEDQYFFQHPGINLIAILKAGWQTYLQRGRQFGASTITMQVARIRYGICSKHILGKFWQMVKALQLEFFYSKKQILEAYLNLASYGGNIEGVGAASAIYLGKSAIQINLCEALNLTVVPQNPRRRIPFPQTEQLWHRWIKKHPEDTENYSMLKQPLQLYKKHLPFFAPHFVDRILSKNRQLAINSTLNLEVQLTIESIVSNYLKRHDLDGIIDMADGPAAGLEILESLRASPRSRPARRRARPTPGPRSRAALRSGRGAGAPGPAGRRRRPVG